MLIAQIGDGIAAYQISITVVSGGFNRLAAVRNDGFFIQKIACDRDDVFAVIGVFWKLQRLALQLTAADLYRHGEIANLHTGVVVIELTRNFPALTVKEIGEDIT